jgi:gas vesicle protein
MNSKQPDDRDGNSFGPVIGFALGTLVGAGIALLLAPASGERTRRRLADMARRVGRGTNETFDQMRQTAGQLGSDAQSAIKAGREAFVHDGEPRQPRL